MMKKIYYILFLLLAGFCFKIFLEIQRFAKYKII